MPDITNTGRLLTLNPIDTCPKDGSYFLAWGPSGYTTIPVRAAVCKWDERLHPRNPLIDQYNDAFTDGGEAATHWSELPIEYQKHSKAHDLRSRIAELQRELETLL